MQSKELKTLKERVKKDERTVDKNINLLKAATVALKEMNILNDEITRIDGELVIQNGKLLTENKRLRELVLVSEEFRIKCKDLGEFV